MKKDVREFIVRNATALATTHWEDIKKLPSTYWGVVYVEIPAGASEDYIPVTRETVVSGNTQEEAEANFYMSHPGLPQNGFRYGSEIEHIENYSIGRVLENGWDL